MKKKQAYDLCVYLLNEAYGILNYADYTDIISVAHILGTAKYIANSYDLLEKDEIITKIESMRAECYKFMEKERRTVESI